MEDGPSLGRKALAAAVAVGAISYLALVVSGTITHDNRLTAAEFGLVAVAALAIAAALKPDLFDRLQKFDFAGIKFELGEVQKNQEEQQAVLDELRLALRLMIGKNEQAHLKNLLNKETENYRG